MTGTTCLGPTYPTMPHMHRFYGKRSTRSLVPLVTRSLASSFLNAIGELLDHRVGEHLAGDAFHLGAGRGGTQAVRERNREILALAHAGNIGKPDLAQRVLDGLALGVQHRWL